MKAVAYIRKSTSGVEEDGVQRQEGSFARQQAAISDYAQRRGFDIVRWYEESVSGKSIRKRKVFLQMVKDAKSPGRPFEVIIFGEYDRLMRDVKEAMRYEVELDDAGVELHFTNLKNDGSAGDEIYKALARNMAAEYSRDLARKVIQGMVRKAKMGSWLGGLPPFGYRRLRNQNGIVSLEIHADEAKTVETIFKLSLKGWGHKRIATWLNDQNVPTGEVAKARNGRNKNPDGKWSCDTIRALLRNPAYKGLYRWNKRARVDCFDWKVEGRGTVEIGKLRTQLPEFKNNGSFFIDRSKKTDEWITIEGKVPAIIPAEIFEQVQERFKPHSSRRWRRGNYPKYFMSSFFRCKNCGNGISGHRYSKIIKQTGQRTFYEYYCCAGDIKKGRHGESIRPMMKREALDRIVIDGILGRASAFTNPERVRKLFKNQMADYTKSKPSRLLQVEQEIQRTDKEIDRIIEAYTKFERPLPELKIRELNARRGELEIERKSLIGTDGGHFFDVDHEVDTFLSKVGRVTSVFENGELSERHRLRDCFLKKAEVDWVSESGVAEVKLHWYKIPKLLMNETSLDATLAAPAPFFFALSRQARRASKQLGEEECCCVAVPSRTQRSRATCKRVNTNTSK